MLPNGWNVPYVQYLKFLLPIVAGASYVYIPVAVGYEHATRLMSMLSAYVLPPLGKESVIPLGVSLGIDPILLVASIIVVDSLASLFVYWNYELLKKIPYVGKVLDRIEAKSQSVIRRRWFGKAWWIGLVIFMIIPFQGSGAASTTIIGRVIGVRRKVLIVVVAGSIASSTAIGFASDTILTSFFG